MGDYSSSDEDYGDDRKRIRRPGGPSTKVFTKESMTAAQRKDVGRVIELLSLRENQARTLLIYSQWNLEKLFDRLVDKGIDQVYAEAGVTEVEHNDLSLSQSSSTVMCLICITKVSPDLVTKMDCGHYFCNNCWTEYFTVKINEGQSRGIRCMAFKCNAICDEAKIKNVVSSGDPDLAAKFEQFLLKSYIEGNRSVKWCPSVPHCGNAITVEGDKFCEVECPCGRQFCFSCLSEAHSPCSCRMWNLWAKKFEDESDTINWIIDNTKPCPQCQMPVEKYGGFDFLSCVCGQNFCWKCGFPTTDCHWSSLSGHQCGGNREDHEKKAELAKKDPWRYIHYHNRYRAYTDLFQIESMLNETIKGNLYKLEKRDMDEDCSWVCKGLFRLFRSRRFLAYTYVFSYYMFGDLFRDEMKEEEKVIKQSLFEDNQQQLEEYVGKLSMLIESPFHLNSAERIMQSRVDVLNLSNIVDDHCKKLYECIENDLLGPLQQAVHLIAPYKSRGAEKAQKLLFVGDTEA